jgi:xylan 1,4-beta-xylosidase
MPKYLYLFSEFAICVKLKHAYILEGAYILENTNLTKIKYCLNRKFQMKKNIAIWVLILMSLTLNHPSEAWQNTSNKTVVIDLSAKRGLAINRASGFLLSLASDAPEDNDLLPLKVRLLRTRYSPGWGADQEKTTSLAVERMNKYGSRVQIMVHDEYIWGRGIPNTSHGWPGDNNSYEGLRIVIDSIYSKSKTNKHKIEWDLWNEPDNNYFWKRTRDQFFNTWKEGHRMIKSKDSKAIIVGPNIMTFNFEWLKDFLLFAKKNNVLPDILSWHELGPYKEISNHVSKMRLFLTNNNINIQKIDINEYCGPEQFLNPGIHVWYFAELEKAKVYGACHACWPEKGEKVGNCFNNSLDGIMTSNGVARRATWYTYKAYADITGEYLDLKPSQFVNGIAGVNKTKNLFNILVGKDSGPLENTQIKILNWSAFKTQNKNKNTEIILQKIPASGGNQLFNLPPSKSLFKQSANNELVFTISDFAAGEAYSISVK